MEYELGAKKRRPNLASEISNSAGNVSISSTIGDRNHFVRFNTICSSAELKDRQGGHGGGETPLHHKRLLAQAS